MFLQSLDLADVRQFDRARFEFGPGFNLLVGENGQGKSTILKSLLTALGGERSLGAVDRLGDDDIRYPAREFSVRVECHERGRLSHASAHHGWRTRTTLSGKLPRVPVVWFGANESAAATLQGTPVKRYQFTDPKRRSWDQMRAREEFLRREEFGGFEEDESETRFGRSAEVRRFVGRVLSLFSRKFERFAWRHTPHDCVLRLPRTLDIDAGRALQFRRAVQAETMRFLEADFSGRDYVRWGSGRRVAFKSNGDPVEQRRHLKPMPEIGSIIESAASRYGMQSAVKDATLEIKLSPRISVFGPDGPFLLDQLSDGEKRIFSMIVDIARQLSLAKRGWREIGTASAIVLIDEIDCHLHPKWQRMIVPALEDLFRGCQFISTTHSPFVIQSVPRTKLIQLDDTARLNVAETGNSIEDIVEDVQGVEMPQRSKRAEDLSRAAERYFKALRHRPGGRDDDVREAERAYREASEPFTLEPGLNALLRLEAINARVT
jgi:predicted ATPase